MYAFKSEIYITTHVKHSTIFPQSSGVSLDQLRSIQILSPITFLLAEMLSLIFEFAQGYGGLVDIRVAIACSHVCRFWRNVALHTASLWTNIELGHSGCDIFADRSLILPICIVIVDNSDDKGPYGRVHMTGNEACPMKNVIW
jgi:hypothetical protein